MRTEQARKIFAELMQTARRRRLSAFEIERLVKVRQILRRRARPAMNPKSRPKLGLTAKEALEIAGAGRRPELLKEGKIFDETRLVSSPLFAGRGGKQMSFEDLKPAKKNPRRPTLAQAVDARLAEMRDIFTSGVSEETGRLIRDPHTREITGRIGGVKPGFRELAHESASPQAIAAAIDRGKGIVYDRVRSEVERGLSRYFAPGKKKRSRGRLSVEAHEALRPYCGHCRTRHTRGEHRFHGQGSFHRTHLFSFNPPMQRVGDIEELRYLRTIGRIPGLYKHTFKRRAGVYRLPDNSILIR